MKRSFGLGVGALALLALAAPTNVHAQDGGPGGGPGGGGARRGPGGRGWGLPIDELKEKLGLSDDQVKKLEAIQQEMMDAFRKAREEMQKDGDFDWTKARERMKEGTNKVRDQIRGMLTDEQKPKFEEYVKKQDEQMARGPGGPGGPDPERMKKRLMDQAEKELALSPEEKAAVLPLIQKVVDLRAEARVAGDKRKEELTAYVRKNTGSNEEQKAELAGKLAEYRKVRDAEAAKIKDAQQALREVLTVENEAKLVALGILE